MRIWVDDLSVPEGLDSIGRLAHATIMRFLYSHNLISTGGGRAFYSPAEWALRGHEYGEGSRLVVVYDGSTLRSAFTLDAECYDLNEQLQQALAAVGLFSEECTTWYSAIYIANKSPA